MVQVNKKVLFIAFVYPPLGGSGVQRSLKFTKYLPEFGWQPYVVCSNHSQIYDIEIDPSLIDEIPSSVQVCRPPFISPYGLRKRILKLFNMQPIEYYNLNPGISDDVEKSEYIDQYNKLSRRILRNLGNFSRQTRF